ncbi:MAG: hypothetical protein QM754_05710 [Tepidisphaeraceae bacterium]
MRHLQTRPHFLGQLAGAGEAVEHRLFHGVQVRLREAAGVDELLGVKRAGGGLLGDGLVHERLGEAGFVLLVVAVTAVAPEVDDDVALELLAELDGHLRHVEDGFGVVAVDVEDRGLDGLGAVGAVGREAGVFGDGGEADLVVDDQVDRAAGLVAGQLREVQGFGDDALAAEGGVAVQADRDELGAVRVVQPFLLAADDALLDRVDQFQVRRVGQQADFDLLFVRQRRVLA